MRVLGQLRKLLRRNWLEERLDSYLLNRKDTGRGDPFLLHASWLSGTPEEIYRNLMGLSVHRPPSARLLRMFDDGLDVQRRYIRYFREMGILYEPEGWDEDRGVVVRDELHGLVGGIDALIRTPDEIIVPVELKAYAGQLFKKFRNTPRVDHVHQLQMYIHLWGSPYGYLLPECKDNQDINPLKIEKDEALIQTALAKTDEVWARVRKELGE